jgi:hypothetical protein
MRVQGWEALFHQFGEQHGVGLRAVHAAAVVRGAHFFAQCCKKPERALFVNKHAGKGLEGAKL